MSAEEAETVIKKQKPPERRRRRWNRTVVSLGILGAMAAGLVIWWTWPSRSRPAATIAEKPAVAALQNRVELSPEAIRQAGIETAPAAMRSMGQSLMATGRLAFNEDMAVRVGTFVGGRVVKVLANVGDRVEKGQSLVYIHSHELMDARAAQSRAKTMVTEKEKSLAYAKAEAERADKLLDAKAISRREQAHTAANVVAINAELEQARVELHRTEEFLEHLPTPGDSPDDVVIRSTAAGIVTKRPITVGTVLNESADVMEIANTASLWAVAEVPEAQASLVRIGQTAGIQVPALGDNTVTGKVVHIGTSLNPETRTVQVRCLVNNTRGQLRPEMYATIELGVASSQEILAVSKDAITEVAGEKVVFAALDGNAFEKRTVKIGREQTGWVEIVSGLEAGRRVVTKGTFFIKTELLKGSLSEE